MALELGFVVAWLAVPAAAQEPAPGDTIALRSRPELTPQGLEAGRFVLSPKLTVAAVYDDNVLATAADAQSTLWIQTSPEVAVRSDWGAGHALSLLARGDIGRSRDFSSEDYDDWELSSDGIVELAPGVSIVGGLGTGRDHVERAAPDDASGLVPTQFEYDDAFFRYEHRSGRLRFDVGATGRRLDYEDVPGIRNGVPGIIDQDDRDRTEYGATLRLGYEISRGYDAFLRVTRDQRDYENVQQTVGVRRSSTGREAALGIAFDLGGITFGNVFVGSRAQAYDAPFPDVETPVYGGEVHWSPSALTTVSLTADRTVEESISADFSGYTSTDATLAIDHELGRGLILQAALHRRTEDYAGIGPAFREDRYTDLMLGSTFLLNAHFQVTVQYHRLRRNSDDNTVSAERPNEFRKQVLLLQVQLQI